jgi:hypothetical protein
MLSRSIVSTGWDIDGMFCPVVISVNHIVRAYSSLALLWFHISLASTAYVGDNGARASTASSKATAITNSRSAGSKSGPSATGSVEGVNVISHNAAVTVGAHAERGTTSTVKGVPSVKATRAKTSTAADIEVEVDSIAYHGDACDGSNECASEVHVYLRRLLKSLLIRG